MKILVKDLQPNPYRKIKKYPIDRQKVNSLKESIKQTEFWENVLARKNNGHIEIAYGHHRLQALKELKIKEVNIPVKNIDNATMIKIMANENMEDWSANTSVINETVLVAKEFLDKTIKDNDYNNVNKNINIIFGSKRQYEQCQKEGVGQIIILKFLGKNWKQWMIQEALSILKDKTIDREAVEVFDKQVNAKTAKDIVKKYDVPKTKQKEFLTEVKKKSAGYRTMAKIADEVVKEKKFKDFVKKFPKRKENKDIELNEVLQNNIDRLIQINSTLDEIFEWWSDLDNSLKNKFMNFSKRFFEKIKNKGDIKCKKMLL